MREANEVTVGAVRSIFESLGAGGMVDGAILFYVFKRVKEAIESSSKEQAVAELAKLSHELKADSKTAELAEIVDLISIGVALRKN